MVYVWGKKTIQKIPQTTNENRPPFVPREREKKNDFKNSLIIETKTKQKISECCWEFRTNQQAKFSMIVLPRKKDNHNVVSENERKKTMI